MARSGGKDAVQFGTPERGRSKAKAERGRLCEAAGCATVLSTYNVSTTCWLHTDASFKHPLHKG